MPKQSSLPVSKQAAASSFDEKRWRQFIRLAAVENAVALAGASGVVHRSDVIIAWARALEKYVADGD